MNLATRISIGATFAVLAVVAHADKAINEANARQLEQRRYSVADERRLCEHEIKGTIFTRTELLFGLSRLSGPNISESEFQAFLDTEVTPRFPDGLTLLSGNGQFRDSAGNTIREGSKVLILLYPFSKHRSKLVDEVRDAYKTAFQQESVLRVDERLCVSF